MTPLTACPEGRRHSSWTRGETPASGAVSLVADHNDKRLRPVDSDGGRSDSQVNDSGRQDAGSRKHGSKTSTSHSRPRSHHAESFKCSITLKLGNQCKRRRGLLPACALERGGGWRFLAEACDCRVLLRHIHATVPESIVTILSQVAQFVNTWPSVYCQVRPTGIESGKSVVLTSPPDIFTTMCAIRNSSRFGCVARMNQVHSSAVCSPVD
jgi:hypothetical protein